MLKTKLLIPLSKYYKIKNYLIVSEIFVQELLKSTKDSWRVDEAYVKIKSQWMYIDFYVSNPHAITRN